MIWISYRIIVYEMKNLDVYLYITMTKQVYKKNEGTKEHVTFSYEWRIKFRGRTRKICQAWNGLRLECRKYEECRNYKEYTEHGSMPFSLCFLVIIKSMLFVIFFIVRTIILRFALKLLRKNKSNLIYR